MHQSPRNRAIDGGHNDDEGSETLAQSGLVDAVLRDRCPLDIILQFIQGRFGRLRLGPLWDGGDGAGDIRLLFQLWSPSERDAEVLGPE